MRASAQEAAQTQATRAEGQCLTWPSALCYDYHRLSLEAQSRSMHSHALVKLLSMQ